MRHPIISSTLLSCLETCFRYLLLLRVKVVILCSNDLRVEEVGRATHNALSTGVLSDKLAWLQALIDKTHTRQHYTCIEKHILLHQECPLCPAAAGRS